LSTRPRFKQWLPSIPWGKVVGELLLIVIGVSLALWFQNVNQSRLDRARERETLIEIARQLAADTADLQGNIRVTAKTVASIDTVLVSLTRRAPCDSNLGRHFARTALFTNFIHNRGGYEYLKAVGLNLISSDSLRRAITKYYEHDVQYLTSVEQVFVNTNWNETLKPQMVRKFSFAFFRGAPAIPNDCVALSQDREYQTALRTTREILLWKDALSSTVNAQGTAVLAAIHRTVRDGQ
jgi:hypothetical protein